MAIPYPIIAKLLGKGKVIPFLGAGVNYGARKPDERWDEQNSMFLPTGTELSRLLADEIVFTSRYDHDLDDLAKVASYYVNFTARVRLRERLTEIFKPSARAFQPCPIHQYLAGVAMKQPLLIVTTNFDDLMEKALEERGVPFDLVVHPADHHEASASVFHWKHGAGEPDAVPSNHLYIELEKTTVVYKIHGTIGRKDELGAYVISEEDYEDFLSIMTSKGTTMVPPSLFMNYFHSRHFLFLGYSLRDWNLRVILRNLRTVLPPSMKDEEKVAPTKARDRESLTSWSIQFEPLDWERELWERRGIKIFDIDINEFAKKLGNY